MAYSKVQNASSFADCSRSIVPATLVSVRRNNWDNLFRNVACLKTASNHQRAFYKWKDL